MDASVDVVAVLPAHYHAGGAKVAVAWDLHASLQHDVALNWPGLVELPNTDVRGSGLKHRVGLFQAGCSFQG